MAENHSAEGASEPLGELAGSGERFARARAAADVKIDVPREEPTVRTEPKTLGSIWVNKENEPEEPSRLEKKTWSETYDEMNDVMKVHRGRSWGEFFEQTLTTAVDQLDPNLKHYEPPEPDLELPSWWKMMRRPTGKLVEGMHRRPWYEAPFIGMVFLGSATAPLPGPNFLAVPLGFVGFFAGLAIRLTGARIDTIDKIMVRANSWVFAPLYRGAAAVSKRIGLSWLLKKDPVGWAFDKLRGGTNAERAQRRLDDRRESGKPFLGAFADATGAINDMLMPGNFALTMGEIRGGAQKSYKRDLLSAFDVPTSNVDLGGLATHIAASKSYQTLKSTLRAKGYECRLVQTDRTVVLEVWKTGTNPDGTTEDSDDSYIPEPRVRSSQKAA